MTKVHHTDDVVFEVAINDHPLVVGEDDDRSDEELIENVRRRTETADDIEWPEWTVFVSDPPDAETLRNVNTATRINVLAPYDLGAHQKEYDVFDAIAERVEIEGYNVENAAMSCPGATHQDDFDGDIHLDLTDEE